MASFSERDRNNIRAGIFVTAAIILSLVVIVALTDAVSAFSRTTKNYNVRFDVSSGVANLKQGSDVRIGGVKMGRVKSVDPELKGDAFRTITVKFSVDSRVTLYPDAQVVVAAPLIGSDAWIDIPNVGTVGQPVGPGDVIRGTASIGMLTSMLGSENANKASEMVENARVLSTFLAKVPDEYQNRVAPMLDDASTVLSDLRRVRWPSWAGAVDRVMTWAVDVTPKLDSAIGEGHDLLANANQMVSENREQVKSIVSNVESATGRINTETIDKFHKVLDSGQQSLDQARSALERLRVDYASWATSVGEALASLNLTSQQLKLASIETRRSPWKLLYRPSTDEVQHELLYEATRSFAVAAADLKATSEAVKRVLDEHGEVIANDQNAFQRLQKNLEDSLSHYEKAQQKMLDVLVTDEKK